jgi:hypothetical protein
MEAREKISEQDRAKIKETAFLKSSRGRLVFAAHCFDLLFTSLEFKRQFTFRLIGAGAWWADRTPLNITKRQRTRKMLG